MIGTRDCGAEDAVIDGVTGLLVPQTDLEHDLAALITRLLAIQRWRRGWALPGAITRAGKRGIKWRRR